MKLLDQITYPTKYWRDSQKNLHLYSQHYSTNSSGRTSYRKTGCKPLLLLYTRKEKCPWCQQLQTCAHHQHYIQVARAYYQEDTSWCIWQSTTSCLACSMVSKKTTHARHNYSSHYMASLTIWRLLHMLRHFDPPFSGLWKICIVSTPMF